MSSGRDEYLSRVSEEAKSEVYRYQTFDEWFKLYLPVLWNLRDKPMSNELVKDMLKNAFEDARIKLK